MLIFAGGGGGQENNHPGVRNSILVGGGRVSPLNQENTQSWLWGYVRDHCWG